LITPPVQNGGYLNLQPSRTFKAILTVLARVSLRSSVCARDNGLQVILFLGANELLTVLNVWYGGWGTPLSLVEVLSARLVKMLDI
jgi:hypothetical protein